MNLLLSAIPWPYKLLAAAALAVALVGFGWVKGMYYAHDKFVAATSQQSQQVAAIKQRQAEATVKVVTEYVDRVQVVRERGAEIVKEVPVYVPFSTTCDLPGGFRLLHDAAARGELPDPAGIADAAPVAAQDTAATVTDNYQQCRENTEQLTALQAWVVEMAKISHNSP